MKRYLLPLLATCLLYSPAAAVGGDLNRDGVVDFSDFFLFSDNFGKTGPAEDECGDEILSIPLTFTGSGTQTTGKFQLESGLRVVRVAKTSPTESIIVSMLDGVTGDSFYGGGISDFNDMDEISKSFQVKETSTYVINVDTGSDWTITLDSGENIPSIPSGDPIRLSGSGSQTTGKFRLESGLRVIHVTKTPSTESIVVSMLSSDTGDDFYDSRISDFDDMGEISKSFQVESDEVGDYVINVDTGGDWTITIE